MRFRLVLEQPHSKIELIELSKETKVLDQIGKNKQLITVNISNQAVMMKRQRKKKKRINNRITELLNEAGELQKEMQYKMTNLKKSKWKRVIKTQKIKFKEK